MERSLRASTPDSTRSSPRWGRARPAPSLHPRRNRRLDGRRCHRHLARASAVRCGISLQKGQLDAAGGAFLLFMTISRNSSRGRRGLHHYWPGKVGGSREQVRFRRRGFILFVVCILLVTIPLSQTAYQSVMRAKDNNNATAEVQQWLKGTSYQVDMVNVNGRVVNVTVEGTGANEALAPVGKPTCFRAWSTGSRELAHASNPDGQVKQSINRF